MNKIFFMIMLMLMFVCYNAKAQEQNEIDLKLERCLADNKSNAEQRNCVIRATKSWDDELNKYYKLLLQKLPAEAKSKLVTAQKSWLSYRDSEYKWSSAYYFSLKNGTMFYTLAENRKMELVKSRVTELQNYLEMLDY